MRKIPAVLGMDPTRPQNKNEDNDITHDYNTAKHEGEDEYEDRNALHFMNTFAFSISKALRVKGLENGTCRLIRGVNHVCV